MSTRPPKRNMTFRYSYFLHGRLFFGVLHATGRVIDEEGLRAFEDMIALDLLSRPELAPHMREENEPAVFIHDIVYDTIPAR